MSNSSAHQDDLAYVRSAIERSSTDPIVPAILWLWAVIILVGFTLLDVNPAYGGLFFAIAGPVGGIVSGYLGYRSALNLGQHDTATTWKQAGHWIGGIVGGMFIAQYLASTGAISYDGMGQVMLLVVALAYFYAGLYVHRIMFWLAGLCLVAIGLNAILPTLNWTVPGLLLAVGIACIAIKARTRS